MNDIRCDQLVDLVTDYLEGVLPADLRQAVHRQLDDCAGCLAYVEEMRMTVLLLNRMPP